MRTRDQKARIHFTEEELRDLDRKAAAAGLDRSKYVRKVVLAAEVKPGPQVDVPALIAVTHQAGLRVADVLVRANSGMLDVPALRRALAEVEGATQTVRRAFEEGNADAMHD
ncbi:MAG: hypothetical protein OSJ58_22130 [Dysosmobacter sp.]|jgi:hypothetical protein|nr:hypothetical protein [Dysosmobacter sp.]